MDNNKIRVTVMVAGQRFTILTDKTEKYVLDIASRIDSRINSLVVSGDMTREKAAVLTALDFADDSENDKLSIVEIKEQIKDYLHEIERLQDDRSKLVSDYNLLKAEYERIIANQNSAEDAIKRLDDAKKENDELKAEIAALKAELETLKVESEAKDEAEEIPLPEEPPVEDEPKITAEDDLFFDEEEEVKPMPQKKKNRHEHNHVNPYQQKAAQQNKGYTQQRQYTFFDITDEN